MMEQYLEVKKQNPGCLLFFRLGDFYEMFFDDALTASKELEITLTGRSCGQEERAPMCGVPYHAAETYIQRLIQKGYKVAICEQMEDPKLAKGIVKREITRIVTPGTNMNAESLEENKNNYICSVNRVEDVMGLAVADVTTGEFLVTELTEEEKFWDELAKYRPTELLVSEDLKNMESLDFDRIAKTYSVFVNPYPNYHYQYQRCKDRILQHFKVLSLEGLGLQEMPLGATAAGALLDYLLETQKRDLGHISKLTTYSLQQYMMLDATTRRNLELTQTLRDKGRKGSLLWVLDYTSTAMGGRLLRKWLEQPLVDKAAIEDRLDAVECFVSDPMVSEELREMLSGIYDMERLMGKISYGTANARDMLALKNSLAGLTGVKALLRALEVPHFQAMEKTFDDLADVCQLLERGIHEEPPITIREGQIIKEGYDPQVDKLRLASVDGKTWLAKLEAKEREATGIKNLRVGYNRVFGYYIEVSKGNIPLVPDRFVRKQTLTNGERYITQELKEIEDTLLGAQDKVVELEYQLFCEIRDRVNAQMTRIQKTADDIAQMDVLRSLGEAAYRNQYCKPEILHNKKGVLEIHQGRHPVVEKMLPDEAFIPNDTYLDTKDDRIAIITGPNMAGKSTYMRQVAIIQLMAQIGSFVPASSASISIADRIFTRVGASDDLAGGQSTFMVEMSEVSNILRHATSASLLILDEIGRGTSTFDGLSIAWAVAEYISDKKIIGAKTLFATHYHELTELEGQLSGVKNYCVAIKESGEDIIFLRKIQRGSGDQSYGIEVAKLAGLPGWVVKRAQEILEELLQKDVAKKASNIKAKKQVEEDPLQISLFGSGDSEKEALLEELKGLSVMEMTPLQAMQTLYDLQNKAKTLG
ncbi:MAG: DNA mismatch repair protein MutS [Clostridia bacterium]|uniref:DNA mismatch repair protein MutS n=2 Tax=Bianquea renquensis TaxID=2763661 RepID=A0A926I110_9FIRM|nr:DNA mismatch repair protein MutS [Bianquea renquensis]MBC8543003.1 DNA mismatch repair protein MutS [Bianquea renquensis]